jgi:hypothetical protein
MEVTTTVGTAPITSVGWMIEMEDGFMPPIGGYVSQQSSQYE